MMREIKASVGQRLLWLLGAYRGQGGALNCPLLCRIEGPLNVRLFETALAQLVARHESLRTTFARRGRQLRQVVHDPAPPSIRHVDHSHAPDAEALIEAELAAELRSNIDPTVATTRITLWRAARDAWLLCLNQHHLVTDSWSCLVLQRELAGIYGALVDGKIPPRATSWQCSQFMAWQERQLAGDGFARQRDYWARQLAGVAAPALPIRAAAADEARRRASIHAALDSATVEGMRRLAARERTTVFVVALAVYYALLYRHTGARDLATATLFANRVRREVEGTVGFLTNLVVLRTDLGEAVSFSELLARTRVTVLDGMANQEVPFHVTAQRAPATSALRLDELVFQMLAEPLDEEAQAGGVRFRGVAPEVTGRFDFELALMPRGDALAIRFYFTEGRADAEWARAFVADYVALAGRLVAAPEAPLPPAATPLEAHREIVPTC